MKACYNERTVTIIENYFKFIDELEKAEIRKRDRVFKSRGKNCQPKSMAGFSTAHINRKG